MDKLHNPTDRVLSILKLLSTNSEGFTLSEIAKEIDSPKSTILPILRTMVDQKFAQLKENSKYTLGLSSYIVGSAYSSNIAAFDFIKEQMRNIVEKTGEICQLGILEGNNILYIGKEEPDEEIRLVSYVGKRLPLYCTAIGKALILDADINDIKAMYPEGLKAFTNSTITDFETLERDLKESAKVGYARDYSEISEHVTCIGVPLKKGSKTIASISVSTPKFRFTKEKEASIISQLIDKQTQIGQFLIKNKISVDDLLNYK